MKTIELDYTKQCGDEPDKGHNRWHPDIPPAVHAEPGEEVVMQTRNAFDMQINPSSQAADLLNADLNLVHPLTGPVYVEGAEPGDLLEVNILNIEPANWGFTTILPGFGFLRDLHRTLHRPLGAAGRVRPIGATARSAGTRSVLHGHHRGGSVPDLAASNFAARR